jgi:hypothetical protein
MTPQNMGFTDLGLETVKRFAEELFTNPDIPHGGIPAYLKAANRIEKGQEVRLLRKDENV